MQATRLALQNFVGRTGRLPCPAVHTDVETASTFGVEAPNPGTCTGTVNLGSGLAKYGTVPWKTLGLSAVSATDGWYNLFSYAVTTTATSTTLDTVGGMRGALTVHTAAPIANGLPATGNQINACSTTAGDNSCNLFASVIIISHGKNGLGAYSSAGVAVGGLPTSAHELKNTIISVAPSTLKTDVAFVNAVYSESEGPPNNYFDDIVMSLTPADALAPLLAQGGVKYEASLLAERFRQLVYSLASEAINARGGSSGSYSYPLPSESSTFSYTLDGSKFDSNCDNNPPTTIGIPNSAAMQAILDPWGTQFRYRRGDNTMAGSETCPHMAVFVSAGPDKNFATTGDNVAYYVTNGELGSILGPVGW